MLLIDLKMVQYRVSYKYMEHISILNNKKLIFILLIVCFPIYFIKSEEKNTDYSSPFSIEEVINVLSLNSPMAQMEHLKYQNNLLEFENYKKELYPSFALNLNPVSFNRSLRQLQNSTDGSYNYVEDYSNSSNLGVSIRQKIPFTGGELNFGSNINYLNEFSFDRSSFNTTPFNIGYSQQLLGARRTYFFERTIRYKQNEIAIKQYCTNISNIQHQALELFMSAFFNNLELELTKQNRAITDTLLQIADIKLKNGNMLEADHKQLQLQHLNNLYSCENAEKNIQASIQKLSTFLGTDISKPLENRLLNADFPEMLDIELIRYYFNQNNSFSISQQIKRIEAERSLFTAKLTNSFNANISLNYGLNQYANKLSEAYHQPNMQQSVMIGLQIPVFQWGINKNKIQIAKNAHASTLLEIEQKEQKMYDEIRDKVNSYNFCINLWKIGERSYSLSQEQYEMSIQKFLLGKISVYELSKMQQEQFDSMKRYYNAVKDVWNNYFSIRTLTLYDFIKKRELVDILINTEK